MSPFVEEFLNFYFKSMAGSGWTLNVSSEFVYMWMVTDLQQVETDLGFFMIYQLTVVLSQTDYK